MVHRPAYLTTGYLTWVVATVLLGDVRRNSPWLTTIGTPAVAAFAITARDLSLDPSASTVYQRWIWENGGGFFGVPLINFLGWTFTVYVFLQVFALYLRSRGPLSPAEPPRARAEDLRGVLLYGFTTVSFLTMFFTGERRIVTDAAGTTWQTGDIYEASALVTIYGMLFIAVLAVPRIATQDSPARVTAVPGTGHAEPRCGCRSVRSPVQLTGPGLSPTAPTGDVCTTVAAEVARLLGVPARQALAPRDPSNRSPSPPWRAISLRTAGGNAGSQMAGNLGIGAAVGVPVIVDGRGRGAVAMGALRFTAAGTACG
jgi:putative membrane protein